MKLIKSIKQEEKTILETYEYIAVGTNTINIPTDCNCDIIMIGGGGGGSTISNNTIAAGGGGGSGAGFIGTVTLTAGTYTITVGGGGWNNHGYSAGIKAGDGGATTLVNNNTGTTIISAGGGVGGTCGDLVYSYGWGGAGGTIDTSNATIVSSTLNSNGNNEPVSSGSSVYPNIVYAQSLYNGYGQGGSCGAGSSAGRAGYFKITINTTIIVDVTVISSVKLEENTDVYYAISY